MSNIPRYLPRKDTKIMEKESSILQKANIDWLQFRVRGVDLDTIVTFLNLQMMPWIHEAGGIARYDYRDYLEYEGVKLYYLPDSFDIMVQLTGKGCTYYEKVLDSLGLTWREFFQKILVEYPTVDFRRLDMNIDDFNPTPYFRPETILEYCEKECFIYGKSQKYSPVGTPKTGMTLYLGAAKSDHKAYIYDKLKERRSQNIVVENNIESWVRLEARFLREYAAEMIHLYIKSEISLMAFIKGYFKKQFHFFNINKKENEITPRFWAKYIRDVEETKIKVIETNTQLEEKINWFFYGGGRAILKAFDFLQKNQALPEFKNERSIMYRSVPEIIDDALYTPELAKLLVKQLQDKGRDELISEVLNQTRRQHENKRE